MYKRGWSFEIWFFWILLAGGTILYLCYQTDECEKMRCPQGTKPRYLVSSHNNACVCEPAGWRK